MIRPVAWIQRDAALPVGGPGLDAQDLAVAFHVHILAGRNVFQLVLRAGFARNVPDPPQRAVFRSQPPQRESLNAQGLRGAHLVQRGHGVEKPDVMLQFVLVQVTDVGIEAVAVEIHVRFRIARRQPGILHGHVDVFHARRQRAMLRLVHPVVTVIADGGDQLVLRDHFDRRLQVVGEPVLRRHRARRAGEG